MRLGVAWYPEQHPPERWAEDARRMAAIGLELVRVGEFAWTLMEPARGRFEWDWLDRALATARSAGLQVVLGTPTAVPPVWLAVETPEILSVGPTGQRRAYGSRRFNCPTSPAYRSASRRIVTAMVERYGSHPAVVAWQLDNEPGNHDSARCWCDLCEDAFQAWLGRRYGTVEDLNRAWGTVFWSGQYPALDAVRLPRETNALHSPSLLLAQRRFSAEQALACIAEQHQVVAAGSPGREIFTNLPANEIAVDHRAMARLGGLHAVNVYPTGMGTAEDVAYLLDLARGHTGRAWVTEHQPGPINWTPTTDPVGPGQVRLWGWRAALHGMEALLFFSWRPTRSGSEQYHTGLLRHDGSADRGLDEGARLTDELRAADPAVLVRPPADVAVLASQDDRWALEINPHRPGLTHERLVGAAHAAARRLGHEVDVVAPETDLTRYRVVLAPALILATPERQAALRAALAAGTIVILGARSLVADADDCWLEEPLPAGFAAALGSSVQDFFGLENPLELALQVVAPADEPGLARETIPAGIWAEVLAEPAAGSGAEVVARYTTGWQAGRPAAVRHGGLAYLGATSVEAWQALLALLVGPGSAGPGTATQECFMRAGRRITLDHASLAINGLA